MPEPLSSQACVAKLCPSVESGANSCWRKFPAQSKGQVWAEGFTPRCGPACGNLSGLSSPQELQKVIYLGKLSGEAPGQG